LSNLDAGLALDLEAAIAEFTDRGLDREDLELLARHAAGDIALLRRSAKRALLGDPLLYITNRFTARGRDFHVDRRVYRPSRNTEKLLTFALTLIRDGMRIADVGTGCGWMAITCKLEHPTVDVVGLDIDTDALEVARGNAARHGAEVRFEASDMFEDVNMSPPDLVIANLPYGTPAGSARFKQANASMAQIWLYHPSGPLQPLTDMLGSLRRRGWCPEVVVETGSLSEDTVAASLGPDVRWSYFRLDDGFSIVRCWPR
jgi:hypothetical protein